MSSNHSNPYQTPSASSRPSLQPGVILEAIFKQEFSFYELLLATSSAIRRYFLEMAIPALGLAAILGVLNASWLSFIQSRIKPVLNRFRDLSRDAGQIVAGGAGESGSDVSSLMRLTESMVMEIALASLVYALISLLCAAAMNLLIAIRLGQALQGQSPGIAASLAVWLRRLPQVLLFSLPLLLAGFTGLALCLVPGWLIFSYFALLPALVGLHAGRKHSWSVLIDNMRGRLGRTAIFILLLSCVFLFIGLIIPIPVLLPMLSPADLQQGNWMALQNAAYALTGSSNFVKLTILQYIQALPQAFYYATIGVAGTIMFLNYQHTD